MKSLSNFLNEALISKKVKNNDFEWVDLGLKSGNLWCSCNLGANKPEEFGLYYKWRDTKGSSNFKEASQISNQEIKTDLTRKYDAACQELKGETPTKADWVELFDETAWYFEKLNGVFGLKCIGKNTDGEETSIFIPAAGLINHMQEANQGKTGNYMSATTTPDNDAFFSVYFEYEYLDSDETSTNDLALSIRPIKRI